jgi:hypothetical protein
MGLLYLSHKGKRERAKENEMGILKNIREGLQEMSKSEGDRARAAEAAGDAATAKAAREEARRLRDLARRTKGN